MTQKTKLIKRCFVLTLERRASRWEMFQRRTLPALQSRGYKCIKFLGVDGRDEKQIDNAINKFIPDEDDPRRKTVNQHWKEYPGSTGCYFGHMSLWKYAYESALPSETFTLILEDDAQFAKYGMQNMENLLYQAQMLPKWDIMYVGHSPEVKGNRLGKSVFLNPIAGVIPRTNSGFWGYIVRTSSFPKLLDAVATYEDVSVDATAQRYFNTKLNALFIIPSLVSQSSMYSVRVSIDKRKL